MATRVDVARLAARPEAIRLDADALDQRAAALASDDDPEADALQAEWGGALLETVKGLPEAQRRVIRPRFFGDQSLQEIAELAGQPIGTVKSRLHRGLTGLRDQIAPRSAQ
jgi:RNA polymerase sigma-70 factor, ECF subfamily